MLTAMDVLQQAAPVMPVMVIEQLEHALPMAKALEAGGITVFEITLRTECALQAITLLKQEMPGCLVGAGTVINPEQLMQAHEAGADFIITPGSTPEVLAAARDNNILLVPGVSSPSQVMQALSYGFQVQKLFPAEAVGGVNMIKSLGGPFPQVSFCPTGGINPNNYLNYLELSNVQCVGGSWLIPEQAIKSGNWTAVTDLAQKARMLPPT